MIPLRVLLIEDSELDAGLILRQLKDAGYETIYTRVDDKAALLEALQSTWDFIIADYRLPGFTASEALEIVKQSGQDAPFVIVSGAIGEETAVELMRAGARDYLMKDKLSRLPPVVERELIEVKARRMQKQAHDALMESERNLKNSQQVAHIGHWVKNLATGEETWSDEMYRILGCEPGSINGELFKKWQAAVHPDDLKRSSGLINFESFQIYANDLEYRITQPDGTVRYILGQLGEAKRDERGRVIQLTGVVHDITERKMIELDLLEKMWESQNRARELEAVALISTKMRSANTHDDLVVIILNELSQLLESDHAAMAFVDDYNFTIEYAVNGKKIKSVKQNEKIGKLFRQYSENNQLGFFEEIPSEIFNELPAWVYGGAERPVSMIAYPLINKTKVIGLIYFDFMRFRKFDQEQRNLIGTVAEMAGNALNRMAATIKLETMVEKRERELESIYRVTSAASRTISVEEALPTALSITLDAIHLKSGAIYLVDEKGVGLNQIVCQIDTAIPRDIFNDLAVRQFLDRVINQRKTVVFSNMEAETVNGSKPNERYTFIGLPMRSQDHVVGVLAVIQSDQDEVLLEELTLLSFIADDLALVVENTRFYKRAERSAVLEERSRLARELHDSVTQSLYSASLYSAGAKRFFSQKKYAEVDSYLTQIGELTQQALKDMRLLVFELRSPEVKRNGLIGALQNRLDAVERRANIDAQIQVGEIDTLPEKVEENLYRIAIESLNNSLKHSQASKITLDISKENDEIVFSVEDNGVGFSLDQAVNSGGVGLATMRERAERIGAKYQVMSIPNKGTKIELRLKAGM